MPGWNLNLKRMSGYESHRGFIAVLYPMSNLDYRGNHINPPARPLSAEEQILWDVADILEGRAPVYLSKPQKMMLQNAPAVS